MLYSCTHMAAVGVKGLTTSPDACHADLYIYTAAVAVTGTGGVGAMPAADLDYGNDRNATLRRRRIWKYD